MLKALADKTRIKIMQSLHSGEKCVADIVNETGSSQANISKHLSLLNRARLVSSRKEGLQVFYKISDPCINDICDAICNGYAKLMTQKFKSHKF